MIYHKDTDRWRGIHAEAAAHLYAVRAAFFANRKNARTMFRRMKKGHSQALREIAREIRDAGIYSRKTALRQVEFALLARLHSEYHPSQPWSDFTRETVGLGWLAEERDAA